MNHGSHPGDHDHPPTTRDNLPMIRPTGHTPKNQSPANNPRTHHGANPHHATRARRRENLLGVVTEQIMGCIVFANKYIYILIYLSFTYQ